MATAVYAGSADTVALNGKIYTVNPKQPWAEAVAIKGTDIVYVGDNEGSKAFIGKETTVADLKGKFVMPGIVSTHEHPLMTMAVTSGLTMEYTEDAGKMLSSLKEYVTKKPDAPAFSFGGSYEGRVEIYRQDIDKIISDRPFLMVAASGHGGWCNTKALEKAGITKDSKDPVDSFQREKDGTPNGYIESSAAVMWMLGNLDFIQSEGIREQAGGLLKEFSKNGLTTIFDAGAPYMEDVIFPVIRDLEKQGDLPLRVNASVITQRDFMTETVMKKMDKYSKSLTSEKFKVDTFKIHADGAFDGYTAGMLEPYADNPKSTGLTSFTPENQLEITLAAAKKGYDIHTHTIGDRTVRQTLDCYEAVRKAGLKDIRLATAHTSLVHPDDKKRFKDLDVIANTYATKNAVIDETILSRLGPERYYGWGYQPMGSFVAMGVKVVMSADMPTAPLNPFLQISIAINRRDPNTKKALPPKSEALTLEQALRAYTIDAAYMNRWEGIIGSLEVGKRADMIVLDRNLFEISTDEIAEVNVLATMMNGEVVHEEAVDWDPPGEFVSDVYLVP
jgi:predicted amidohydrolase YtcJ